MPAGKTQHLAINTMAGGDTNKYILFNDAVSAVDDAMNKILIVDVSASDKVLSEAELVRHGVYDVTGGITARAMFVPVTVSDPSTATQRSFIVHNKGTAQLTILHTGSAGATAVLAAGATATVTCDGTDVVAVAGFQEAPTDGAAYARKDGAWAEVSLAGGMYDMEMRHVGTLSSSQVVYSRLLGRDADFAADFGGSVGKLAINPTATIDLDVQAAGVSVGAISIDPSGGFSFSTAGGVAKHVLAGDEVKVVAPLVADPTASDVSVTLIATSTGQTYVALPGHRYWRVLVTANSGDASGRFSASEIEFRNGAGSPDLTSAALAGVAAFSKSFFSPNSPNLAFDDLHSSGTWYTSDGSVYAGGGEWIAWDFGASNNKDVVEVGIRAIHTQLGLMPAAFTVQFSDDGATWTDSWAVSTNPAWSVPNELKVFTKP